MGKKPSKLGLGFILGTAVGSIAALLLSPKTGKENRAFVAQKLEELQKKMDEHEVQARVREIFGSATEEGTKMFKSASREIADRLKALQEDAKGTSAEGYIAMVNDVVGKLQTGSKATAEQVLKLKKYFTEPPKKA